MTRYDGLGVEIRFTPQRCSNCSCSIRCVLPLEGARGTEAPNQVATPEEPRLLLTHEQFPGLPHLVVGESVAVSLPAQGLNQAVTLVLGMPLVGALAGAWFGANVLVLVGLALGALAGWAGSRYQEARQVQQKVALPDQLQIERVDC